MDNELRRNFEQINKKLDKLTEGESSEKKPKSSIWKRISITVSIVVAIIGLMGTAYELGLIFLENQSNRRTIEFYTSLAKSLVENGDYGKAQNFLNRAEEIDANNAEVVVTKAFVDMMELIRRSLIDNRATLSDGTYYLSQLNLEPTEIQYHLGIVAAQEGILDIAEDFLKSIPPGPDRFSLLARSKLIGDVYLQSLFEVDNELNRPADQILNDAQVTLTGFIKDVQNFEDDPELGRNFRDQVYAFGFALIFRLPRENLPELEEAFRDIDPPNEEFLATLRHQLELSEIANEVPAENEEKILKNLYAAKEKSGKFSPVTEQINDVIMRYSAQMQLEESEPAADLNSLQSILKQGIQKRKSHEFEEANRIYLSILDDYEVNNRQADETLYKTYFNLALLNEYNLYKINEAIRYYSQAEELANLLELNDPSIHNTVGFLYYKLGRDAHNPDEKTKYLNIAEEKLKSALAIDPYYAKSINTLDGVQIEFKKLERQQLEQQQIIQMTNRR